MEANPGKERDDKRSPGKWLKRADRIKKKRQGGRNEREQDDERDKGASVPQDCRDEEQHGVTLELERNRPQLRVDHGAGWIVIKDARQREVHETHDIAEVADE